MVGPDGRQGETLPFLAQLAETLSFQYQSLLDTRFLSKTSASRGTGLAFSPRAAFEPCATNDPRRQRRRAAPFLSSIWLTPGRSSCRSQARPTSKRLSPTHSAGRWSFSPCLSSPSSSHLFACHSFTPFAGASNYFLLSFFILALFALV